MFDLDFVTILVVLFHRNFGLEHPSFNFSSDEVLFSLIIVLIFIAFVTDSNRNYIHAFLFYYCEHTCLH